ncbi:MAG: hypothetical protein J6T96_04845 [Bacteroidales bacterium]|nr:hypothetical protein [Bacteroidales bacterium]
MTLITGILVFGILVAVGIFVAQMMGPVKSTEPASDLVLSEELKPARNVIDSVMKDYSPTQVISNTKKRVTIMSKDEFNDVGRVFMFSMDTKTHKLDIKCKKFPGTRWSEKPTEYDFHVNYQQDNRHNFGKEEKNVISQIKQKMLFFPSVKRYKVMEDF